MASIILLALFVGSALGAPVQPSSCDAFCMKTFALHTSPNTQDGGQVKACSHGCIIMGIVENANDKVSHPMPSPQATHLQHPYANCTHACKVAYKKNLRLMNACTMGCRTTRPMETTTAATTTTMFEAQLPPIGPLNLDVDNLFGAFNEAPFDGWLHPMMNMDDPVVEQQMAQNYNDPFMSLRRLNSGNSQSPHLLGEDGGAKNPFASELSIPTPQLLGTDGGVRNPFAHEFQPPSAQEIAEAHGSIFDQNDFDAFFRNMERMHERMNAMIRQEMNDAINTAQKASPNEDLRVFVEFERFNGRDPPQKFVWSNSPEFQKAVEEREHLDLTNHEPSPPTSQRAIDNVDEDEVRATYRHTSTRSWLGCARRRFAHMSAITQAVVWLTIGTLITALIMSLVWLLYRFRTGARGVHSRPPSALGPHISVSTIDKPPAYASKDPLPMVHEAPPKYDGTDNPNYTSESEKKPDEVKIVA